MVMLAVMRLEENAYGVPISREIENTTKREVAIGSVYAALERLEDKSLVASRVGEPTAERGGSPDGSPIGESIGVRIREAICGETWS